jgi:hypothetical protein
MVLPGVNSMEGVKGAMFRIRPHGTSKLVPPATLRRDREFAAAPLISTKIAAPALPADN